MGRQGRDDRALGVCCTALHSPWTALVCPGMVLQMANGDATLRFQLLQSVAVAVRYRYRVSAEVKWMDTRTAARCEYTRE